jgi:hypothetical protein
MRPKTTTVVSAEWATDATNGALSEAGWPKSGVLLFSIDDATPAIAIRPHDVDKGLRASGYLAVGVGPVLVDGDALAWGELLVRLGSAGVRPGLLEAPMSTRSRHQFTARISATEVAVHSPPGT